MPRCAHSNSNPDSVLTPGEKQARSSSRSSGTRYPPSASGPIRIRPWAVERGERRRTNSCTLRASAIAVGKAPSGASAWIAAAFRSRFIEGLPGATEARNSNPAWCLHRGLSYADTHASDVIPLSLVRHRTCGTRSLKARLKKPAIRRPEVQMRSISE